MVPWPHTLVYVLGQVDAGDNKAKLMTKLAPEWVRTSDPEIRSPVRYRWTTAPATKWQQLYYMWTWSTHCGVMCAPPLLTQSTNNVLIERYMCISIWTTCTCCYRHGYHVWPPTSGSQDLTPSCLLIDQWVTVRQKYMFVSYSIPK